MHTLHITHTCTYVINIEVELIWDHPQFGEFEPPRDLPGLVPGVSAMPNESVKPACHEVHVTTGENCLGTLKLLTHT